MTRNISTLRLVILFVYIAVPVYVLAWGAGLFTYPDYQASFLRAKGSADAEIPVRIYYRPDGQMRQFDSEHSVSARIFLHADDYSLTGGTIKSGGKAIRRARAEFGKLKESGIDTIEITDFSINGRGFSAADSGAVILHDLELSDSKKDSAVLKVTGSNPYIETRHSVNFPRKDLVSGVCAGLLSFILFLITVRVPVLRRLAGLESARKQ